MRRRIADIARAQPDRTALVGFDTDLTEQVLSWREFTDRVADAADALSAALDRRTRSCAVVLAGNTVPAAIGIAAALTAEVPVFPLNPGTPPAERDTLLGLLGRRFGHGYLIDAQLRPERMDFRAGPEPPAEGPGRLGTVAYLLATGASTGIPKISARPGPVRYDPVRTPSLVIRQASWRGGQRQLIVGPLYHAAPFTAFLDALLDSNTVVLQPFFAPQWTVELVRRYAIEWLQLTPTHMREILRLPDPDPAGFASLRAMLHTAARCDADTKRGWIDLLGPERVYELYGATEGVGVTLVRGDEWLARPGTVGRGFLTQVRILDEAGNPVPPGMTGTVFMRTPQRVGRSDYVSDQAIRATLDGFATIGDHGRLDRDGYLYLEPRDHDTINVGGEKVDPDEVEAALRDHPAVIDAVAVAVPHQTLGSVVGAHIVLRPGASVRKAELAAHCGRRLAGYKIPKHFTFVDQVPRSAAGKIQRWRLAPYHENGASPP
ncbi:MAG TPA: AMP-binding protein [Streptosporangiaceae bacterium]|nr:AMP-binding protein [Streptosporangiaceae bacterium]